MESLPSDTYDCLDSEYKMFLTPDILRALEDEVWRDTCDRIARGVVTQEQGELEFIKWRTGYIDGL